MAESIGFGVTAVSRLSARNTIRQEDSGLLCLPCPALPCARKAHLPGSQFRAATCLFEASSYRPFPPPLLLLIARSNHRLPHETVSRPVDWTTYGSDSFRFSHPILPIKMERAQIPFLFHLWREYRSDDILDGILDVYSLPDMNLRWTQIELLIRYRWIYNDYNVNGFNVIKIFIVKHANARLILYYPIYIIIQTVLIGII